MWERLKEYVSIKLDFPTIVLSPTHQHKENSSYLHTIQWNDVIYDVLSNEVTLIAQLEMELIK